MLLNAKALTGSFVFSPTLTLGFLFPTLTWGVFVFSSLFSLTNHKTVEKNHDISIWHIRFIALRVTYASSLLINKQNVCTWHVQFKSFFLTALINCHETGQVQQVLSLVPSTGLHDNGMSHLIRNAKGPVARRKRVTTRSSKSFDLHVYQELQFSLPHSRVG